MNISQAVPGRTPLAAAALLFLVTEPPTTEAHKSATGTRYWPGCSWPGSSPV